MSMEVMSARRDHIVVIGLWLRVDVSKVFWSLWLSRGLETFYHLTGTPSRFPPSRP